MSVAVLVRFLLWGWFGLAVYAAHAQWLATLSPMALPAIELLLATTALMAVYRIGPVRVWVEQLHLRSLVLLHVTRFVGVIFLVMYQRGQLPAAFAVPVGFGEITIALFALPVALAPLPPHQRLRVTYIWNVIGGVGALLAVATLFRLNFANPDQLAALTTLPLSLLPTFLSPLLIATHVIIFVRLSRTGPP